MNEEQLTIIKTLERGHLFGRTSGESRVLGGMLMDVATAREEHFPSPMLIPEHAFAIERNRATLSWVGLVELNETSVCIFADKDPSTVAQGMVNYFALAKASGMTLRHVREQLNVLEQADIQIFAVSATELQLYWKPLTVQQSTWLVEQGDEAVSASLHLDVASQEWKLKDAEGKKVKSGTLAEVSRHALEMRDAA
jgi:hypothetical protein